MGCDNKPHGEPMAWMNWWSVEDTPPLQRPPTGASMPPSTGASGGIKLTLLNDAPVPLPQVTEICARYINTTTGTGNIKPSSVIAVGNTLYAGVQCMTYDDHADPTFVGRQVRDAVRSRSIQLTHAIHRQARRAPKSLAVVYSVPLAGSGAGTHGSSPAPTEARAGTQRPRHPTTSSGVP